MQEQRKVVDVETKPQKSRRFVFVLLDKFSMLCFASALESLRIANRMAATSNFIDMVKLRVQGIRNAVTEGFGVFISGQLGDEFGDRLSGNFGRQPGRCRIDTFINPPDEFIPMQVSTILIGRAVFA